MTLLQAIVLGIVQGLTEFLPISSTAHLLIVPRLLGWADPGAAFSAVIQIGTLVAVLLYFWTDVWRIGRATFAGLAAGRPLGTYDARLGWLIAVATLPIVVVGLVFQDAIETTLRSLYVISASLIGLAVVLSLAELYVRWELRRGRVLKQLDRIGWGEAIVVGLAQAVALVPGSSRAGVTITGGLFCGLSREAAARFSFLCSLPSIFAAGVYELYKEREALVGSQSDAVNLLAATAAAAIVGYWSIGFLLRLLRTRTTLVFIVYRLVLGFGLLAALTSGVLQP
ncbi:MAG: undecaprenyl-diphosphatase UppP [Pirellulales bacterium]